MSQLSTWTLFANALCATYFIGERVELRDVVLTVVIDTGKNLAATSAYHAEQRGLKRREIEHLLDRPSFSAYLVIVSVAAATP